MNDIPQRLYDSEINFEISCFWDGGFDVKLGDHMNGFVAEENVDTYAEALAWLDREARDRYPGSVYATGKWPDGWRRDGDISATGAPPERASDIKQFPGTDRKAAPPDLNRQVSPQDAATDGVKRSD